MNEFSMNAPSRNISSGFIGTTICWVFGLAICVFAVAFSLGGSFQTKALGMLVLLVGAVVCGWARTSSHHWKLRLAAVCISSCLMLVLSEGLLRIATQYPVNERSNIIPHAQLGYVLDPKDSDVDANGFRNSEIPATVDIVAIGDSHTQGFNVTADQSWPAQLAKQLNKSVYNMGIGGYGPLQYQKLIAYALALKPKQVILGLYLGNDLSDVVSGITVQKSAERQKESFRQSIKYHTAVGSMVSSLFDQSEIGRPTGFEISHTHNPTFVSTARIESHARSLDLQDPKIAAALQQTATILSNAKTQCLQSGVRLVVMLIPTRESVYLENQRGEDRQLPGPLLTAANREQEVREWLTAALTEQQVEFVDILPPLAAAINAKQNVYARHDNGHPLANGYATYAATVSQKLSQFVGASTN